MYKYTCSECKSTVETDLKCVSVKCGCGVYMSGRKKPEAQKNIRIKRDN